MIIHIIYLFTGYEDDGKVYCPPIQQLFHEAKPREIVAVKGGNILPIV